MSDEIDPTDDVELSAAQDAEVARLLATLPPMSMPADVAAGIEGELAAAAVARGASASTTLVSLEDRRRRFNPRVLALAAVLVAVVAGSVIAIRQFSNGSAESPTSAAAGSIPSPAANRLLTTRSQYTASNLAAGIRSIIPGAQTAPESASGGVTSAPASPDAKSAGTIAAPGTEAVNPGLVNTRTIPACLELVQPRVEPILVDQAFYNGQPALVVVYPFARSQGGYPVYVMGARCGLDGNSDLLEYQLVAKP
jgi:hypothetical protein